MVAGPDLPNFVACPRCHGLLVRRGGRLECQLCGADYRIEANVPILLAADAAADDLQDVRALYDDVADHYDAVFPFHIANHYLAKRVAVVQALTNRGRLLDVGCGTGALGAALAGAGYEVFGIDLSAHMLAEAGQRGLAGAYAASATALPFQDGCFDLALCVAALHHLATPERVAGTIAEMARVVRPGGHVLLWDHNPLNPYWLFLMKRVPQDSGAERLVPMREILADVAAAALSPVAVHRLGLIPEFIPTRLMGIARLVERLVEQSKWLSVLAAHNVVVARKPDA